MEHISRPDVLGIKHKIFYELTLLLRVGPRYKRYVLPVVCLQIGDGGRLRICCDESARLGDVRFLTAAADAEGVRRCSPHSADINAHLLLQTVATFHSSNSCIMFTSILASVSVAVLLAALWKVLPNVIKSLFSPLRALPGPPSDSLFFGNLNAINNAENSVIHEEWLEKYGDTIAYSGLFNVCSAAYSQLLRPSLTPPRYVACLPWTLGTLCDISSKPYSFLDRALNHVLTHSMDYQRSEEGRYHLARVVGPGVLVTEGMHKSPYSLLQVLTEIKANSIGVRYFASWHLHAAVDN